MTGPSILKRPAPRYVPSATGRLPRAIAVVDFGPLCLVQEGRPLRRRLLIEPRVRAIQVIAKIPMARRGSIEARRIRELRP